MIKWFRVLRTYEKPRGGFLAHNVRYPGVVADDGLTVLFSHPGDPQWTEVVPIEHLEEAPDPPPPPPSAGPDEGPRAVPPPPEQAPDEVVTPLVNEGETVKKEQAVVAVRDPEAGLKPPPPRPLGDALRDFEKRVESAVGRERFAPADQALVRRYFEALRRLTEPAPR